MATTGYGFAVKGDSVGSLRDNTSTTPTYANAPHKSLSFAKASAGKIPSASDFTTYAASRAAAQDIQYQAKGVVVNSQTILKKELLCMELPAPPIQYTTSSDRTRQIKSCSQVSDRGVTDAPGAPLFEDNTIRLSSGVPSKVDGCCVVNIEDANHTPSPGLPINKQIRAYGKSFYVASNPQPSNVAPKQGGGYVGPRSGYVENKHGFVQRTEAIPVAPGGQGQTKATLRINDPTFFKKD
jgi:hypothetical protein